MANYRSYYGRKKAARRRRSYSSRDRQSGSARRAVRLYVCIGLFAAAVLIKLLFPATFAGIGDKINTVVNYKAALATLGEGFSGEKKFTAALGEAFTYAFVGQGTTNGGESGDKPDKSENAESSGETIYDEAVETYSEDEGMIAAEEKGEEPTAEDSFADAVIAAFMQNQEQYSDYAIPAGVTYGMPGILIKFTAPLSGVVSSPFGYREHPKDGSVSFHYGTDIAANSGTKIAAFADGKAIDVDESDTLGKYIVLKHGDIETQYAHCSHVFIERGQAVKAGQEIAAVGMTGDATNPHLHFEMKVNGVYVNPEYYIKWH